MKLSRGKSVMASFFLLTLAACEGQDYPHVFGANEVPPEVMAEPRVVETPAPGAAQNQTWMRLGDVPSKPADFTPQKTIDETKQQLADERAYATQLRDAAGMPLPPQSVPAGKAVPVAAPVSVPSSLSSTQP